MKKLKKTALILFTVLILILNLILNFIYSTASASASPAAVSVKIAFVKKTAAAKHINSIGTVRSNGRLIIFAPFTGRIIESFPHPGPAPAGAVIARIVNPGLYAKIIFAGASVKYAKTKYKREKLLFSYGVAAQKDVERARLSLANALSELHALESVEREGVLISHFEGTVHYLTANGAIVTTGSAVAVLNGKGAPWIKTYVTTSQRFGLYTDMPAVIKKGKIKERGRIISIAGNAAHNGLVPVYINLPEKSLLLPGEWVNISFTELKTAVFSLPEKAIIMLRGKTFVFAAIRGKAQAVKVEVTGQKNGIAYVKGDIGAGEPVIVYPVTRIIPGIPVTPQEISR